MDSLADMVRAAADAFGFHEAGEDAGGLEGGDVAGGVPVPERGPVVIELVLGEKTASLTSRVRARPSSPLPSRPAVSFDVMGTPTPSMAVYSLSGSGDGGPQDAASGHRNWCGNLEIAPVDRPSRWMARFAGLG